MMLSLRASTSRLVSTTPSNPFRQLATAAPTPTAPTPAPAKASSGRKHHFYPREWAKTPQALLELIGRDAPKHLGEKGKTWDGLNEVFKQGTAPMKEAGVGVKDRKYFMSALSHFRSSHHPAIWVKPARKPKEFRRWGEKVQKGVRVFEKHGKRLVMTGYSAQH